MKPHYFDQDKPDPDDTLLKMSIHQGYVPETCLLNGNIVWGCVQEGKDPCEGCNCSREKCHGRANDKGKQRAIERQDFKIDKSKLGCIDRLCLVDFEEDRMEIFIIDLVTNNIILSKTHRGALPNLVHQAMQVSLAYDCTRIVFDTEKGASGRMWDHELDRMVEGKFPFRAVQKSKQVSNEYYGGPD
jgi:hypothetical protein